MNELTFDRLSRFGLNAEHILDAAADNPHPILKAIAPRFRDLYRAFDDAFSAVLAAETTNRVQAVLLQEKLQTFGSYFDGLRGVISGNIPHEITGQAASRYPTPLDLLGAAERLGHVLTAHGQEPWAAELSPVYAAELESFSRTVTNAFESQLQEQKLRADRRAAAEALSGLLVDFRRVVKAVYGSTSREYHSIKVNRRSGGEADEAAHPAPAAPATPIPAAG